MQKYPIVAIVGRPNVGKSTLFNRIVGFRQAITSKEPGTTRDRVVCEVLWNDKNFLLVDTAGFLVDFYGFNEPEIESQAQARINETLVEAEVVLFVVDSKVGVSNADLEMARSIRKIGKNVILVCNKADTLPQENVSANILKFGFDEVVAVSAISGRRIGNLLDLIVSKIVSKAKQKSDSSASVAIVGRPNVGKSTIFNALADRDIAIVSSVAGTTRDARKLVVEIKSTGQTRKFEIIDTAGLRKRGHIKVGVEKFSALRSIESVMRADLVILIIDATEGFTRQDSHLAQLALTNRKKLIIVLNKLDLLKRKTKDEIKNLYRFKFLKDVPMIAVSARSGENLDLLREAIIVNGGKAPDLANRQQAEPDTTDKTCFTDESDLARIS